MTPEERNRFLSLADQVAVKLGGESFEAGLQQVTPWVEKFYELLNKLRDHEQLISQLDQFELSPERMRLLFALVELGPEFLRYLASELEQIAAKTLPAPPERRPTVPAEIQYKMVKYVDWLYIGQGVPLGIAKMRTAEKFGWKLRTVNRYWKDRRQILESGPKMRLKDLIDGLKREFKLDFGKNLSARSLAETLRIHKC